MITIDGTAYNVPFISLTRKADFLYKFAERTVDGNLHTEMIGVYFNYELKMGAPNNATELAEYKLLWAKLTEADANHTVVMPDQTSFEAYFSNISDALRRDVSGTYYWKDLTVNFIAREPAATP
jgi:hypothetical protein